MTQEDKAKAYDEALKRAKLSRLQLLNIGEEATEIEYIFPELKESEGEKIRKEIIAFLKENLETGRAYETWSLSGLERWIAWLEKQGEKKPAKSIVEIWKDMRFEVYQQASGNRHEPNCSDDTTKMFSLNDIDEIIEKISEHKLVGDFKAKDWYVSKVDGKIHNIYHTDKVEPKFHKGEWITNGDYIWKIVEVKPLDYILQSQDDNIVDDTISHVDEQFHSFTIEDAKDGDVLAYVTDEEDVWIMIYWSLYEPYEGHVHYHALLVNDDFSDKGTCCICINDLKPATKEQRDLLFQKMKEAGWEFDFDKKELKKFHIIDEGKDEMDYCFTKMMNGEKVSSTWSEEDDYHWMLCLECVEECATQRREDFSKTIDWLKSCKQKMEAQ